MIRTSLFALMIAAALPTAHADDRVPASRPDLAPKAAGRPGVTAVTADEVGDADSFGRDVRWLGLLSGSAQLLPDCTAAAGEPCHAITPGFTAYDFPALDSITLPARSSRSLLCHWQTPIVVFSAHNPAGSAQEFNLRVTPYYTIRSEVFDGLSDPNTGVPYGGQIVLALTGIYTSQTLAPGASVGESLTGSRMCIGGMVSRQSLVGNWGLTEAQADQFFRRPVTITLGIRGRAALVDEASLYIGTRLTGD